MAYLLFLYASGWAFFVGAAMIISAAFVPPTRFRLSVFLFLVGALAFVAPSSTPLSVASWSLAAVISISWLANRNRKAWIRTIMVAVWTLLVVGELRWQFIRPVDLAGRGPIFVAVIGDSLTAGLSKTKATNWPKTLEKGSRGSEVHDFAVEGATCRKAFAQAERIPENVDIVIVEIGGNDVLGSTTLSEFERDYDALLRKIRGPGRVIIGFELPLPPFHNQWSNTQREIARKNGVRLIPKWRLMRILADPRNTVDSIHPTQAGQDAIAELVAEALGR